VGHQIEHEIPLDNLLDTKDIRAAAYFQGMVNGKEQA
jgi:hypothetical protein